MRTLILFSFALVVSAECLPVERDRIIASDLFQLVPELASVNASEPVAFAPIPGATRIISPAEVRRIGHRFGVEIENAPEVCFEYPTEHLDAEKILPVMREELKLPEVNIEILEISRYPVPRGKISFPIAALTAFASTSPELVRTWRGTVTYSPGRRVPIWAKVRVWVELPRVVSSRDIPSGQELRTEDMTVAVVRIFPVAQEAPLKMESALGRKTRNRIPQGHPIEEPALFKKQEVTRGSTVEAVVSTKGVNLSFSAQAETGGALGDSVRILNPTSGRRLKASVSGPNSVLVKVP